MTHVSKYNHDVYLIEKIRMLSHYSCDTHSETTVMSSIKRCLINVDLQNDFITGSLALKNAPAGHDAEELIPIINHLTEHGPFDLVVYSLDYHPPNHISFVENANTYSNKPREYKVGDTLRVRTERYPHIRQILWPRHCVQGTEGARLWSELYRKPSAVYVHKGMEPLIECYSAFGHCNMSYDTGRGSILQSMDSIMFISWV